MIEVLEKRQRLCVLQVSRGSGPRAVEEWVHSNISICFDITDDSAAEQEEGRDQEKPVLASQFYSAYAQSLVLFVRSVSDLAHLNKHVRLTVYCLVKGHVEAEQILDHELRVDDVSSLTRTIIMPISVSPSNSLGTISLVKVSNLSPIHPRQFRRHLKAAGYPVLGRAKDSTPFRGESLCMGVTCLEFDMTSTDSSVRQNYMYELAVPTKFRTIVEREGRFWNGGAAASAASSRTTTLFPSAYVTGTADFCGSTFAVSPSVMIPRKGSAALVNLVVKLYDEPGLSKKTSAKVLDLGTGSGCLLLSILRAIKGSRGVGIDASSKALDVALQNANTAALTHNCSFHQATFDDLTVIQEQSTLFDIVVCNPPYHTRGGRQLLDAAVAEHEPGMALFVERSDMLIHYRDALRSLVGGPGIGGLLATNAIVVFEVFRDNAESVSKLMIESGLSEVKTDIDSRGCVRTAQGVWR
jgi:HemK-like putative methylase